MAATLGQAFDLAYKKYLEAKQTTPAKEQVKALKDKVLTKLTTLNESACVVFAQVVTTDKEKEELLERIAKLEREKSEKSVEAELLKQQVMTNQAIIIMICVTPQVMNLQDKRFTDGKMAGEAPFELNIPRPETKELDSIIKALESQIEDLGVPDEGTVH